MKVGTGLISLRYSHLSLSWLWYLALLMSIAPVLVVIGFQGTIIRQSRTPVALHAKPKPKTGDMKNIDTYIAMRELQKIKAQGGGYEDYVALKRNTSSSPEGYKRLVGRKGTLDQRLRAVVVRVGCTHSLCINSSGSKATHTNNCLGLQTLEHRDRTIRGGL